MSDRPILNPNDDLEREIGLAARAGGAPVAGRDGVHREASLRIAGILSAAFTQAIPGDATGTVVGVAVVNGAGMCAEVAARYLANHPDTWPYPSAVSEAEARRCLAFNLLLAFADWGGFRLVNTGRATWTLSRTVAPRG